MPILQTQIMEGKEDVNIMARVKSYLEAIPKQYQNRDYSEINKRVDAYVKHYCKHDVARDSVDIDMERSKTIYYCETCLRTFTIDEIYKEISSEINYSRNVCDMFLFYKERLFKIENVRRVSGVIELDCSHGEDNVQTHKTYSLGISVLAGCRFEGNVLWLAKQKISETS
jgi:hypothetical protein